MAVRSRDVVVAAAFAVLALIFVVEGWSLPSVSRGIPGPGLFPLLVAVAVLAFSVALALQTLLRRRRERTPAPTRSSGVEPAAAVDDETGLGTEIADEEQRSVLRPLLLWVVVLLVCIELPVLGFLPAMLLLTLILLLGLERRFDLATLVTAVAVPVACYVLFAIILDVRLPTGFFG